MYIDTSVALILGGHEASWLMIRQNIEQRFLCSDGESEWANKNLSLKSSNIFIENRKLLSASSALHTVNIQSRYQPAITRESRLCMWLNLSFILARAFIVNF